MSYSGLVTRIITREHPNADKLAIGQCGAYQVVVGKDTIAGTLGVFFAVDGQLSEPFCKAHDLISRVEIKVDPTDSAKTIEVKMGGYFSDNRKVRCQKLRGEKSEGFWMPLTCLAFTGVDLSSFKEGDAVESANGVEICKKHYTPATLRRIGNQSTIARTPSKYFLKHFDTGQFKREGFTIPKGVILDITAKLHGTSARFSHALNEVPSKMSLHKRMYNAALSLAHKLPLVGQKIKQRLQPIQDMHLEYQYLNGTRNVVLENKGVNPSNPANGTTYYGNEGFRFRATDPLKDLLYKGETLYGELVGFTGNGDTPIMGAVPVKDKEQQKVFGKSMTFSYGCNVGACEFYIYRITMLNVDGFAIDLSPDAMRARCVQLKLKVVPRMCDPFVYDGDLGALKIKLDALLEKPSILDSRHVEEGVCIRWEGAGICKILKHKSFTFLGFEDAQKSDDNFVDTEEVS